MSQTIKSKEANSEEVLRDSKGMFRLHCDNSKRRGYKPVQHCDCEGVQYSSGHVHLDTVKLPVNAFSSMQEMFELLGAWGKVEVIWDEEVQE